MSNDANISTSEWGSNFIFENHLESHLIFGPMSRSFPLWPIMLAGYIVLVIDKFWAQTVASLQTATKVDALFYAVVGLWVVLRFKKMTLRQQAIAGWVATKVTGGIFAFICITMSVVFLFSGNKANSLVLLVLGIIWFPGWEFIKRITPHQKYLTIARVLVTIPCVYLTS